MTALALDHLFVCCTPGEAAADGRIGRALAAAGLVPSYTRRHGGQGTANVCYCFDNAYLELLFVADPAELAAPAIGRTGLAARLDWRRTGASPFGIGLRGAALPLAAFDYRFEALPPGLSIAVAAESADIRRPFLFRSPGDARPDAWTDGRAGARQTAAGLTEIRGVTLRPADGAGRSAGLDMLERAGLLRLADGGGRHGRLTLDIDRAGGGSLTLELPHPAAG